MKKEFELKEEHIKLLTEAYVSWFDCEFGAPAIDCKRPYGNSYVLGDINEILNIGQYNEDEGEFSRADEELMIKFHEETQTALQIILSTKSFKNWCL